MAMRTCSAGLNVRIAIQTLLKGFYSVRLGRLVWLAPPPVSQFQSRIPGSQEKGEVETDLEENQETLGCMVRADNARMTQVTPPPTAHWEPA